MTRTLATIVICLFLAGAQSVVHADDTSRSKTVAKLFLQKYCIDCHGADTQEADLAFDKFTEVDVDNAQTWQLIWEQVALKQMPPDYESNQPNAMERLHLSNWITNGLQEALKDKGGFQTHLTPAKGNHLEHDLLFGPLPSGLEPTSTPARIWRIHPQEHLTRLNELINREPEFDPARPGLRTRGDQIPPNDLGEVKVYYGLDRLIG